MKRIDRNGLGRLLALCALGLGALAAAPSSANAPQALQNGQALSAVVTGNRGGAFDYYTIHYPGDVSVVTIEVRYHPADAVANLGFGFHVYGCNGFRIGRGKLVANDGGVGVLRLQYSDSNPASWLVQVYNYLPGSSIDYSIQAEGLPAPAAGTTRTTTEAATVPEATHAAAPLCGSGHLTGNAGGAYAVYKLTVPADAADVQVKLTWSPDDPVIATGVGFVAYGPSGQVRRGDGTGCPGERKATLAASEPGAYQIQVYNYIDGLTIQYALQSAAVD